MLPYADAWRDLVLISCTSRVGSVVHAYVLACKLSHISILLCKIRQLPNLYAPTTSSNILTSNLTSILDY